MKVAVDTGSAGGGNAVRGIGVHTSELLRALKELRYKDIEILGQDFGEAELSRYDLVHYTSFHPHFLTLPAKKPAEKVIVTIHDLIPLIYPKHYPPGLRGKLRFLEQKRRLKNVDAIITISETSKKDICRFLKVSPGNVHVVYLAPKKDFLQIESQSLKKVMREGMGLPKKFILYVGDVNYNKNIITLIKASKILRIPLVVVGKSAMVIEELAKQNHPELAHLNEVVKELGDPKQVLRLGYLTDVELVGVYNLASVYCQPSFYEGFGLPLLEAMACGCPVVASRIQVHVEIAVAACLFADPKSPEDIAEKIQRVMKDKELKRQLIETGKVLVEKYSWDNTARETMKVYDSVLKLK